MAAVQRERGASPKAPHGAIAGKGELDLSPRLGDAVGVGVASEVQERLAVAAPNVVVPDVADRNRSWVHLPAAAVWQDVDSETVRGRVACGLRVFAGEAKVFRLRSLV